MAQPGVTVNAHKGKYSSMYKTGEHSQAEKKNGSPQQQNLKSIQEANNHRTVVTQV
jgi:hypothetical protein